MLVVCPKELAYGSLVELIGLKLLLGISRNHKLNQATGVSAGHPERGTNRQAAVGSSNDGRRVTEPPM